MLQHIQAQHCVERAALCQRSLDLRSIVEIERYGVIHRLQRGFGHLIHQHDFLGAPGVF